MAKIENTTVYPLTTPSVDDFIIGTDTSDENRTVSFSIESITATSLLQGLQSVLDTSYIATQNISLTGNITVSGTVYPTTITAQGSTGTSGQLLSSTATGIQWINSTAAQDLDSVLTEGNTTTLDITMSSSDINSTGSINMSGAGTALSFTGGSNITLAAASSITTEDDIILGSASVLNLNATSVINDATGAVGSIGQVLTVNAAGTGVEWSTGIPVASMPTLQEVLTSGNTASGIGMAFTGSSATTFAVGSTIQSFAPNQWQATNTYHASGTAFGTAGINLIGSLSDGSTGTGTTDQVLTSTVTGVQWKDVSAVGVSSVTTTNPIDAASSLMPITITPTSGAVLVRQNIYNGGSLIGCVPAGGTAGTFLQGDGTWVAPTGAVSSVSSLTPSASTGPTEALKITPTTGAVLVQSNYFAGSNNVGHVPDASAAGATTDFLRADGTWAAPGGAPEWVNRVLVSNSKWNLSSINHYYIYPNYNGDPALAMSNDHGASSPAVVALTDADVPYNILQANTTTGCATAHPNHKICEVEYSFIISVTATIDLNLWNTDIGGGAVSNATPVGSLTISASAGTLYTGTFTLDPSGVQNILLPGKGVALTLQSNTAMTNNKLALNMFFKYQAVT